jgi:hypothetical protein
MGQKVHHDGESEASHYTISVCDNHSLRGARKLVRGLRQELTEEERYRVAVMS